MGHNGDGWGKEWGWMGEGMGQNGDGGEGKEWDRIGMDGGRNGGKWGKEWGRTGMEERGKNGAG